MTLNSRSLIVAAVASSMALLGGALVFQALGYAPCKLCIWQRWPHGAAIAVGAIAVATGWHRLAWVGALAALATSLVGFYHSGVERGVFAGPDTCTSNSVTGLSPEELLNQILEAPLVRCDEVAWSLMGLSMASWNAILSLVLVAVWVAAARRA